MIRPIVIAIATAAALLATLLILPPWLVSLSTAALARGILALGIVLLMRAGLVSFGQGLYYAIGGYIAAVAPGLLGLTDVVGIVILAALAAGAVGVLVGPLLARYSGVFFGMLTLALSMVFYGVAVKTSAIGGSDGLNVMRGTLFGHPLSGSAAQQAYFAIAAVFACVLAAACYIHFRSERGLVALAIRDNALRMEYLGTPVRSVLATSYAMAGAFGGVGGAIAGFAFGHVDPDFAYWTTSGELMFIAILGGSQSVAAAFVASFVLELVRSFSALYFPNMWQLFLGLFILAIIAFLPRGIGALWVQVRRPAADEASSAESARRLVETAS